MPYLQLRGAQYYYEDDGEGLPLVFGHSMLFNLRMFDDQVAYFRDRYRCLRFDFRGQGMTEITTGGYDLDSLTEDVAELIRVRKASPCVFVGFSMGGMVAIRLAAHYPDLVRALILIDTSSEPEPRGNMGRNKLMAWVARYIGLRPVAGKVMSLFFGRQFKTDRALAEKRKLWKQHFLSNDRIGVSRAVKGVLGRQGVTDLLPSITVPALILLGDEDELTDMHKARILANGIKKSEMQVVHGAAHMTPVEKPEEVNRAVEEFLNKIE